MVPALPLPSQMSLGKSLNPSILLVCCSLASPPVLHCPLFPWGGVHVHVCTWGTQAHSLCLTQG